MLAFFAGGDYVQLAKGCDCADHNDPHFVHEDYLWAKRNRAILPAEGADEMTSCRANWDYRLAEFAREHAWRETLRSEGGKLHRSPIVQLVHQPCDEPPRAAKEPA